MHSWPLLLLASLLLPRTAAAGSLTYEAPAGCPSEGDVAGRAARRAPDRRDAVVTIHKRAAGFEAHLRVGSGDDALERDVEGRTCDAVVDAALLVLSLDEVPEPPAPVAAASIAPAADTPSVAPRAPDDAPRKPFAIAVGLDAETRELVGGGVSGGTLFGELSAPGLFGWTRFRPSVRLGGSFLANSNGRFIGVTAEICPLGVDAVSSRRVDLTFSACGVFDGGSAHEFTTTSWFDLGGLARARVQIGPKAHVRPFFELSAGIVTPLDRHEDNSTGGSLVVTTSSSTPTLSAAGGLAFPEVGRYEGILAIGGGIVFP